ncbi:MAG: HNH endonuclease [Nanoarchaeota archaeon]|nr:HNH endonuclease [Nanoarchaeota archaeon]
MEEHYLDDKGYFRYTSTDRLIHRVIAYEYLYLQNPEDYPLGFCNYVIHHKDENKVNNFPSNLQILTREEHDKIHAAQRTTLTDLIDMFYNDDIYFEDFSDY